MTDYVRSALPLVLITIIIIIIIISTSSDGVLVCLQNIINDFLNRFFEMFAN